MKRPRDPFTVDLFSALPADPVVERFDARDVQSWSLAGRLSKSVSKALEECGTSRAEVAKAMAEWLKEDVSKATLDAYASQARDNSISAMRLAALTKVTGDARPLNELLADVGLIVVPAKYEALLRREKARELRERAEREEQAADAEWKARR